MRGARARHRWLLLVWPALVLALGLVGLVAPPASAAPAVPTITLIDDTNTTLSGDPFAGEEFAAQSAEYYDVGNPQATAWVCSVDFGDGTPPSGFWRSRFDPAPCAQFHAYAAPGSYTITMTVTDPAGDQASSTRQVDVARRTVTTVDGGVEGTPVHLTGPGVGKVLWTVSDSRTCSLTNRSARGVRLRCTDDGTFTVTYTGRTPAESGQYVVTFVNGAPEPTLRPTRVRFTHRQTFAERTVHRVGTGDAVTWIADAHDPSYVSRAPSDGDTLTCVFDFGNGQTYTEDLVDFYDQCRGETEYDAPGVYTATVTVTDDSGASATTTSRVKVVRRDVTASASGRDHGLRGSVTGTLTPAGVSGPISFTLPSGHQIVGHVDRISVSPDRSVELTGPVRLDGRGGYFVFADIDPADDTVLRLQVDRGVYGRTDNQVVESAEGTKPAFTATVHAPRVP